MKKILSLHLPISEYDSLEESDDSAEVEARANDPLSIDSPPTFAESAALTRAHVHHQRHHPHQVLKLMCLRDIFLTHEFSHN